MALNKKRRRVTNVSAAKRLPRLLLSEALELALAGKRTEGLRERTLTDYKRCGGILPNGLTTTTKLHISMRSPRRF